MRPVTANLTDEQGNAAALFLGFLEATDPQPGTEVVSFTGVDSDSTDIGAGAVLRHTMSVECSEVCRNGMIICHICFYLQMISLFYSTYTKSVRY